MLLGGLIGFLIGITFGLAQGSPWPAVLWRSSAVALAAGLLLRWWGRMWARSLQQAHQEQLAATAAQPVSPVSPAAAQPAGSPAPRPDRLAA
ncbi:MAG: hypothetical protein RJA22_2608 [Verrucomicrobiota bacterium]